MDKGRLKIGLSFGSSVLPIVIVWLGTQSAYWAGTISGNWPYTMPSFFFGIIIGITCITFMPFENKKTKIITLIIYIPTIVISLFFVGLFTACSNGDCL